MATIELTNEQVVDLVQQLPPERKRDVLLALASDASARREQRMQMAEEQLRRLCAKRGLNWDGMSEDEREALVDDLIHEDRSCPK
jgi:Mg/Co/Ni transporter MgtE